MTSRSVFPEKPDERCFYSDVSLEKIEIMETFRALTAAGKLDDAIHYLRQFPELTAFSASAYNWIEEKLSHTQTYLKSRPKICPFTYCKEEPGAILTGHFWIDG